MTAIDQSNVHTGMYFNLDSGYPTPFFQELLNKAKIVFENNTDYFIENVNDHLQSCGCFQKNFELYRDGGDSAFKLTYEQAIDILNLEQAQETVTMPREKIQADAVFLCGVKPTVVGRFKSLKAAIDNGYNISTIHFISGNEEHKALVKSLVENEYQGLIGDRDVTYTVAIDSSAIFESGLKDIESQISDNYMIISDPKFASKVEGIAIRAIPSRHSIGVASVPPFSSWNERVKAFGYTVEKLGSEEKATIALARSSWNFIARAVHAELRNYKSIHKIN
ncbi:MAG: hypothetical protein VX777_07320 [Chlamydiota bacterium]|nr:hypothetical protein [Chlamydiota bacterium]